METVLAKIRPHTSSSLAHQKAPATLLRALEATFRERDTVCTSTAYFAALLTTLEATLRDNDTSLTEGAMLPAELYLLGTVIPFVPQPIIRTNLNTLLSLTGPLFSSLLDYAPPLRSQLTVYHTVLQSLDRAHLDVKGVRQTFSSILQLCLDSRPKVRRKAAEVVRDVLATPPTPLVRHPYALQVAEWTISALAEANTGTLARPKSSVKGSETAADTAIHILAFLRPVLANLPPHTLPSIINLLLTLPRLGNPYLSQSAYSILCEIFTVTAQGEDGGNVLDISEILKVILSSPPLLSDFALSSAWVQVLGNAMLGYSNIDPDSCSAQIDKVWKAVWVFLESSDSSTRRAAAESLKLLTRCFSPKLLQSAIHEDGSGQTKSTLHKIIVETMNALGSLAFARSISELLSIISSLIDNLADRPSRMSPTYAESLVLDLIKKVGDLRIQKGFEYKEAADDTLAVAMRVVGPEVLLRVLPLNLEPSDRTSNREPRAFLLPLLSQPHSSPLRHFVSYFVPLSERMFELQQNAESEGRPSEAKVWSVLLSQIWAGLSGYRFTTVDLSEALTPAFSQMLSQLLYGQPDFRPHVLKALKVMVDNNVALTSVENDQPSHNSITPVEASRNVAFLRGQAESWLAVFFNVYSNVNQDSRGMVGDVISSWISIAGDEETSKAYRKIMELLEQNLAKTQSTSPPAHNNLNDPLNVITTTLDLLILFIPHLPAPDALGLFELVLSPNLLTYNDNGVQKRAYKILGRLVESGKVTVDVEHVLKTMDEVGEALSTPAMKDRFHLFSLLILLIPSTSMHIIPSLVLEAVLGTKQASEKTRKAAFELVVAMGKKMNEGGIVQRRLIDITDQDNAAEVTASIEEYMTMVAGGLTSTTPYVVSATVTAISRLVFEFKDNLSSQMLTEILITMLVFLSSPTREIVKSVLGFVKLAIHTLPLELIRPHLKELVPALLSRSHDHKNHFKAKIRHIFERLLRRFAWDEVYAFAENEDAAKVLVNIKKRKDRAKRKKALAAEGSDEDEVPTAKPSGGDAFEDALYGSESELDGSDDDQPVGRPSAPSKRKGAKMEARLRVDDDEPMDLLEGAASRLTVSQSTRHRKPGQEAARFKTDTETGKMMIEDDSDSDVVAQKGAETAGTAYGESLTSVDGFTRGVNGRIKFNKDTKKRRRENEDLDVDVEMAEGDVGKGRKNKKNLDLKLGHKFKAKKAGGDVKKGNVDPYAYLTLSQAAKSGRRGSISRIGIAGKR